MDPSILRSMVGMEEAIKEDEIYTSNWSAADMDEFDRLFDTLPPPPPLYCSGPRRPCMREGDCWDQDVVSDFEPVEVVRMSTSSRPNGRAFSNLARVAAEASRPFRSWLNDWDPSSFATTEELLNSVAKGPDPVGSLLDLVAEADEFEENYVLKEPAKDETGGELHHEVQYIVENWANSAVSTVCEQAAVLRDIYSEKHVKTLTWDFLGFKPNAELIEELKKMGFVLSDGASAPNLLLIGAPVGVSSLHMSADMIIYLTLADRPVGRMEGVVERNNTVVGTFRKNPKTLGDVTLLKRYFKWENSTTMRKERLFKPFFPHLPSWRMWKSGKREGPVVTNPFSCAFLIGVLVPFIPAVAGMFHHNVQPTLRKTNRSIHIPHGLPPGAKPRYVRRFSDDDIAAIHLETTATKIQATLKLPEWDVIFEDARPSNFPKGIQYYGWGIVRKGYLVNPVFSSSSYAPIDSTTSFFPYWATRIMKRIGGVNYIPWTTTKPVQRDACVRPGIDTAICGDDSYWAVPFWGGAFLQSYDGEKLRICAPYAYSDSTSIAHLKSLPTVSQGNWTALESRMLSSDVT